MKQLHDILPSSLVPFGINREQAATVVGVSPTVFDQMVEDGRMPQPRMPSRGRCVWDVEELGAAWRLLPHRPGKANLDAAPSNDNPWDRKASSR